MHRRILRLACLAARVIFVAVDRGGDDRRIRRALEAYDRAEAFAAMGRPTKVIAPFRRAGWWAVEG